MKLMSPAARSIIAIGSPDWCWTRLGAAGDGILSCASWTSPLSLPVPYVVIDRLVTVSLAWFNHAGWSAAGLTARLEVSGITSAGLRWMVRATGTADQTGPRGLEYARRAHPSNQSDESPPGAAGLVLLTPRVQGCYETSVAA
jgi:hypothetical protein